MTVPAFCHSILLTQLNCTVNHLPSPIPGCHSPHIRCLTVRFPIDERARIRYTVTGHGLAVQPPRTRLCSSVHYRAPALSGPRTIQSHTKVPPHAHPSSKALCLRSPRVCVPPCSICSSIPQSLVHYPSVNVHSHCAPTLRCPAHRLRSKLPRLADSSSCTRLSIVKG